MSESELECTYATCSVKEDGQIEYIPTLEGNIAYGGIFLFILMLQVFFGVKYKTWGFMVGMICGLLLEIVGYAGRVLLHDNVFEKNYFIIYLVGLTIGPAFLSASIYLCLGRIITIFGNKLSLLKPKIITWIFVCCDLLSLLLQSAGGAITSISDDAEGSQRGIDIMMAGLWSQVISLSIFIILCSHFAFNVVKSPSKVNPDTMILRQTIKFKCFLLGKGPAPEFFFHQLQIPWNKIAETNMLVSRGCSHSNRHAYNYDPVELPTRRAARRLQWTPGKRRSPIYDPGGPHDHRCCFGTNGLAPRPCLRRRHVEEHQL